MVGEEAEVDVKLIIQPDAGLAPLVKAVRSAKRRVDIVIFRFDRSELEKARGGAELTEIFLGHQCPLFWQVLLIR